MGDKNIAFWFGTEAEVIKSFPVILGLRKKYTIFPKIIATGQNNLNKSSIVGDFNISPDITLHQFNKKKKPINVVFWFFYTLFFQFFKAKKYIKHNKIKYIVVHGDTLSTLMGALIGRLSGAKILHLEGGLRTFKWLKPFPEEIDRFIVGHLSSVHFCQNTQAMENVKNHRGEKIFTEGNVIYDVVDMFLDKKPDFIDTLGNNFGVVTFHRAESIYVEKTLDTLLSTLFLSASQNKVLFVLFDSTKEVLSKRPGLLEEILTHKNIITKGRLPYSDFCYVMGKAEYIITDGGSNQEELAHLGTPTLIMRKETERTDGLGKNIILSKINKTIISDFLLNYKKYNHKGEDQGQPTKIVVDHIYDILS